VSLCGAQRFGSAIGRCAEGRRLSCLWRYRCVCRHAGAVLSEWPLPCPVCEIFVLNTSLNLEHPYKVRQVFQIRKSSIESTNLCNSRFVDMDDCVKAGVLQKFAQASRVEFICDNII